MARTNAASRVIAAPPDRVYAALVDPEALTAWLPPDGMSGRFERFDARPGGSYRLVLTYADASTARAKTTANSDIVEARFVDVVPGVRVVQAVDLVSGDPAHAGTMIMTWEVTSVWVAEHGWCYLSAAVDCCTREITGWALDVRCRAVEAAAVVDAAVAARQIRPGELTLGTDNGTALTARAFRARLAEHGITHRLGGYRDPESQAFIESWFSKLKERCVWREEFETLEEAARRSSPTSSPTTT